MKILFHGFRGEFRALAANFEALLLAHLIFAGDASRAEANADILVSTDKSRLERLETPDRRSPGYDAYLEARRSPRTS